MSILDIFRGEHAVESLQLREIFEKFSFINENDIESLYSTEKEAILIVKDEEAGTRLLEVLRGIRGKKIYTSDFYFYISKLILNMEKTRILAFHIKYYGVGIRSFPRRIRITNLLEIIGAMQGFGYFLDDTDFNEEISTSLTGLLSLMHKSEETSSHRCCIMKIVHRYYCSTPFDDFYKLAKKGTLIRLDNLPYCLELYEACLKSYETKQTPESIYDIVTLEVLRERNSHESYNNAIYGKISQAKEKRIPIYLYSGNSNSVIDKKLVDNKGKKHQVYINTNISDDVSRLIEERYIYLFDTTKINIIGHIANPNGKIIGYEYSIKDQTGFKPMPLEKDFSSQAEKIAFIDDLTDFILNDIKVSSYQGKSSNIMTQNLKYKLDEDGCRHFQYEHIGDIAYIEGQSKDDRLIGILNYFKKMYFKEETLKCTTREEILACDEIRYLSPRLAQECVNYILGFEDKMNFANELNIFMDKYEISSNNMIAYYKNYGFDPEEVKYHFDFEVKGKLDFYTQRPIKDLKLSKEEYETQITTNLKHPKWNIEFIQVTEIVFKTNIVGVMYETEGYNTNVKPKKYLTYNYLIAQDNIKLSRFLKYAVSYFNYATLSSNIFFMDDKDNIYIDSINKHGGITTRKKIDSKEAIIDFISNLEKQGFDKDRISNILLYDNDSGLEHCIALLDSKCRTHNLYYNEELDRICPICGKTLFYLKDSDYLQKGIIHEDKYAKHYKLNDVYNLKIYNDKNVNLNELEKIVDEILSRNNTANKNMYEQDLFIPLKKALKEGKFVGVLYESVCFDDANQKNYVMNFNDLKILKSFPRLKGCARLVEQVNSLVNKRLGFIYNPYGAAFISKEHKKQIQIVYPEFITKNKNVDLADDWTLDFVKKVFTQDKDILHEFNFKPGVTTLENASNEMNSVINSLDKKCEKHNYRYDKSLLCCPKCIPIEEQDRLRTNSLKYSQKQISELHEFNEGGEAIIYDDGENLIKIFKSEEVDMNFKISVILRILSKKEQILDINRKRKDIEYVIPKSLIISEETNDIIGYTMKKVNGMAIQTLRDKEQVEELGFKEEDILEVLISEGQAIDILHKELNIFIGDLNGRNILFDENKKVYVIDFDGIGIDEFVPEFYTDEYVDPISKENKSITYKDDWYSYAIHTFYYLTYTHPFNGTYYEKRNGQNVKLDILEKMERRISLLGNHGVKPPSIAKDWSWLRADLIEALRKIFEEGSRECIVPLLIAQRNKELGVITLNSNSNNNFQVGAFKVDIEDRSNDGVERILSETMSIENYNGYRRLVANIDGQKLAFDVPDLDLIEDAQMTANCQNIIVFYPNNVCAYNLCSELLFQCDCENRYDYWLYENNLYFPNGKDVSVVTFSGINAIHDTLKFKTDNHTTAVGVTDIDKYVIVKLNQNNEHEVYCNDLLFYTFKNLNQSNDFTVFYDKSLNHWLVIGNQGEGILITSSGRYEEFKFSKISYENLNYAVFHKDKIFLPQDGSLITYDIHKQNEKIIQLDNFIYSNSRVIVTKTGFKIISGSKIYTFKVNKQKNNIN